MSVLLVSGAKCDCWEGKTCVASELRSVAGKGLEYLFCSLAISVREKFFFQENLSQFIFFLFIFVLMIIAGKVEFGFGFFTACCALMLGSVRALREGICPLKVLLGHLSLESPRFSLCSSPSMSCSHLTLALHPCTAHPTPTTIPLCSIRAWTLLLPPPAIPSPQ